MRRRIAALGVTIVGIVLAVGIAAQTAVAVTTQNVSFHGKYDKRDRHKARAGLSLRTTFSITDPGAPAPLQLDRTTLRFPKGAIVCPNDVGTEILARFHYEDAPDDPVTVELSGCQGASNGHLRRLAARDQRLIRRLEALTG